MLSSVNLPGGVQVYPSSSDPGAVGLLSIQATEIRKRRIANAELLRRRRLARGRGSGVLLGRRYVFAHQIPEVWQGRLL
jgi:hypothetical protein